MIHAAWHNLDYIAAALTGISTLLLAHRIRLGFLFLMAGLALWCAVGLYGTWAARPIWGTLLSSLWGIGWAYYGWRAWRK